VRAAVPPIILSAVLKLIKGAFSGWISYIICAVAFALALFTNINIVFLIIGGAAIGILACEVKKRHDLH